MPAIIWEACEIIETPLTEKPNALCGHILLLPVYEQSILCFLYLCGLRLHCALTVVTCVWGGLQIII